ncbi:hypothetical protein [Nostoc sp. GT001]|uniref:hypothetical protein n=1 Tax=Nostoc sp. GT001 TaxID=3056647 RepID=UPI0025AB0B11|nr:hypothetical protein [Nostoc sp. GT001]MDM9582971.1 hypothetical protein [Nostoc sp. GT001]
MQRQRFVHLTTSSVDAARRRQASLAEVALVRVNPIQLSQYSEPEPDIAVIRIDSRKYIDRHSAPNKIFLLSILAYLSRF